MPGFFNSLSSYFSQPSQPSSNNPHTRTRSHRPPPDVLSSTRDAFSLPSHYGNGRSGSPVGGGSAYGGGGSGRRSYQDDASASASRSESPAYGENVGTLSRPDRANLGGLNASTSRHDSSVGGKGGPGYSYPPPAREGGYEYNASRNALGSYRNASPSGSTNRSRHSTREGGAGGPNAFSPNGPLIYYPPLRTTWNRIQRVLANTVPELLDTLSGPVDTATVNDAEAQLGCVLPPSVRDSYACVDGQDPSSELKEGLFFGLTFLNLEDSLREWSFWRRVEMDPGSGNNPDVLIMMSSIPSGWIRSQYACRGWLPLITDRCGNYVGVDLNPGEDGGSWGQVIVFGREFDRKCVLFRGEGEGGWGRWLAGFAEELESGDGWEIDGAKKSSGSDGSDEEDDVGYQSYYYDGNGSGGGDSYGEVGSALRLTGEYKGWGVLEAWWDRSVRRWDELGMGLSQTEIRRQQEKIDKRRSARMSSGDSNHLLGLGFGGMRLATPGEDAQVAIPVLNDPRGLVPSIPAPQPLAMPHPPASPGPETALLVPRSPSLSRDDENTETPTMHRNESSNFRDYSSDAPVAPTPRRLITPYSPTTSPEAHQGGSMQSQQSQARNSLTTYASSHDGLLSPPSASPLGSSSRRQRVSAPPPAVGQIDLPTRADVQAAQAVAMAEEQGLRGGWVMSMEAAGPRRSSSSMDQYRSGTPQGRSARQDDQEMVDVDLEGGRQEKFGSSSPLAYAADNSPVKEGYQRAVSPLASGSMHSRESSTNTTTGLRTPDNLRIQTEEMTTPKPRAAAPDFFSSQPFDEDEPEMKTPIGKGKGRETDFKSVELEHRTSTDASGQAEPTHENRDEAVPDLSSLSITASS